MIPHLFLVLPMQMCYFTLLDFALPIPVYVSGQVNGTYLWCLQHQQILFVKTKYPKLSVRLDTISDKIDLHTSYTELQHFITACIV